jgi:Flp pilus assembly protein TadB
MASLQRRRAAFASVLRIAHARRWLTDAIERAGWNETADRLAILALAFGGCLAVIGTGSAGAMPKGGAAMLGLLGFCGGCALPLLALSSAVTRRRRRLSAELVPILELFTLELSGGGSALSALGSVTVQVQGELAADLRRMLIASQLAGSPSFESRLLEYADRFQMPALGSLATILAASREYGTGASQGVRALATDLRRAQRRELIAHSRHALNSVLLPAAVGVLLPFLGVLMFPAVSVLQRNLR